MKGASVGTGILPPLFAAQVHVQSAGTKGNLTNTTTILGSRLVVNKAHILRERGIDIAGDQVFCACHPRAVADLLYYSLVRGIFPAHVSLDGGIFEEEIDFGALEEFMTAMIPHLNQAQFMPRHCAAWFGRVGIILL